MHKVFFSFVIPIWLAAAVANNLGDVPMIANEDATNQRHFSAGVSDDGRIKRALYELKSSGIMGNVAVKFLLRGARQILSHDRHTRTFEKSGSYQTALKEFWAIKPKGVSTFDIGKDKGYFGQVGDRVIMVETKGKTGQPTMRIMRNFGTGKEMADEIVYKSRLSSALSSVWKKNH